MKETSFDVNLQMFADGGAGAGGGDGGQAAAATEGDAGVRVRDAAGRKQKRENPLANVQYGIQPRETSVQVAPAQDGLAANKTGAEKASFDDLIKGEYKADFDARVQEIIRNRFKANAETESKLESMTPLLEMLGKKYNVDSTDIDKLTKVIGDDDSLYEDEAVERGMSVESLKLIKQMERENARLQEFERKTQAEQQMQQHFMELSRQGEELKKLYPGFDLMTEIKNPTFARLTAPGVGVDVRTAYEVAHRDELRGAEMQYAAQKSAERMANAVRSNSRRPVENGLNGQQTSATVKIDPRTFNKDDRAEIKRRVLNGEKIVF